MVENFTIWVDNFEKLICVYLLCVCVHYCLQVWFRTLKVVHEISHVVSFVDKYWLQALLYKEFVVRIFFLRLRHMTEVLIDEERVAENIIYLDEQCQSISFFDSRITIR